MKMPNPYMVILKMDDVPVDLARLDKVLVGAKGYYELLGESGDDIKYVLRFNLKAFRNNYGLADLGWMYLMFHGVLVGKTNERGLNMDAEMAGGTTTEPAKAPHILDGTTHEEENFLDVLDVLLAGVEYVG